VKRLIILLAVMACCCAPVLGQSPQWDNLQVLGVTPALTDETGATLTMAALRTKYGEPVVGMSLVKSKVEVRFYMNPTTWDTVKQTFIMARDQWPTLQPTQFEPVGSVKGYRIANRLATLEISLQGATSLSARRLMLAAAGGADKPRRASVALKEHNLDDLVENLYKVDEYLRKP
jgi:hypothetical protein